MQSNAPPIRIATPFPATPCRNDTLPTEHLTPHRSDTLSLWRLAWLPDAAQASRMTRRFLCLPVDVSEDPRTIALCATLRCDHGEIYLIRLWNWAVRQSPDGMIGIYDDAVISHAARWPSDPSALVAALRTCGWLEGEQLADWRDLYRVESDRASVRRRVAKHRAAKRNSACNVTETEFSLSLNSKISSDKISDQGGSKGGAAREIPALSDPWQSTDEFVFRAWLLAIDGPARYLALPDPEDPLRSVLNALQARFPAWDGSEGRPTLQERAESTWDALRARVAKHSSNPYRALTAWTQWVGDGHDRAAATMRRSGGSGSDLSALTSSFGRSMRPVS